MSSDKICKYCDKPIDGETSIEISIGDSHKTPIFHNKCFLKATKQITKDLKNKRSGK